MSWDNDEEGFTVDEHALVTGFTEKGIWVKHELAEKEEFFPNSHIHDDSELHSRSKIGDRGTLVITQWLAGERGYA